MTEIIIYPDVLQHALEYLRDQFAIRDDSYADGVTVKSYIPDTGRTLPLIWMRRVGGFTTGRATDRARCDVHVYHEDEAQAHDLTQLTRGLLLAWPYIDGTVAKGAFEFSGPGPVPDDLWPDAARWYFTVEFVLRGHAAGVPS
jgi:hypothetical protein